MRKLGIAIAIIVVILIAAVLIVPHLIDVNQYHGQIQSQLEKRLGRQVTLGKMGLRLFPPAFDVENTTIAEDPHFATNRPFATADKLAVSVKFWPLLHKQLDVNSLELVHPHIELVRNPEGVWNFATLGKESKPAAAQKTPSQPAQAPTPTTTTGPAGTPSSTQPENKQPAGQLTLANLFINDGQVAITDLQKHQSRAVYDHIDLNVSDFAPDQQFSMKLTAHLPGEGKQTVMLEGKGGPIQQADMLNTPFDGTLRMDQVSTGAAQKFLNSQALNGIDSVLSGDAKVTNSSGKISSSGSIKLVDTRIRKVNVDYPITLNYDVTDDLTNDVIQIRKGNIKLGGTPITIAGTVNSKPNPSQIDLKLTASDASIVEMARLALAFGVAFNPGADVKGTVNANLQARGPANKPAMNGQVSAKNLDISGKDVPQPVHVNDIELTLTPDAIRSNDFAATTGSTSVNANFTLSNYSGNNSTINAALRAPNARLGEILNIARAAGVSAVNGVSGDGTLNLDVHAQGPTKKMAALDISGTGKISNANLKLPSLTKPLQVRNSDIQFNKNSVVLQNVSVGLGQATANGALTLKNFEAPVVQFTLNAGGPMGEILDLARTAGVSAVDGISGDGTLTLAVRGQGPIKNTSALDLSGTGKISNANLKLPSLTKPLQVRNSDIQFNKNSIGLQNVNAGIGQTNATGTMALRNFAAPQVQFALNVDKVNVTELQQIFNAAPAQPKRTAMEYPFWNIVPKAEAQAPVNNNPQPSLLTKMTGGGTVAIGVTQYDDLLLNNAHANVTLDHGLIKMNPVTADVYNGKENGAITIDMRPAQPVYTVNLKTDKVDANKLISSVSDVKQTIYGLLASNVNASFSSSSSSSIARSLNGSMAINLTNGKLMNINLLHELASVGKFIGANFDAAKNFTDLVQLTGNFDVKNGVAQTNNLNAVIDGGTLAAAGLVNLADQSLNLHVTTVLNKALSQQVGGTQVGGYMNTALANNQGELVMPVIITGTFQHPHVAPDVQQIAQMKLKNMLPNTRNPAQLTTGILGAVLGEKNQGGAAGQPANGQPKGGIGGILDAISGKQQQQNQQNQPQQQQQPPAVGNNAGRQQQQSAPAGGANQGQEQPKQSQPQEQNSPAAGANQAPQPTATPASTPGWGDVLNQVLNRKKKEASPTPTPQQR
ncbi:MAG TPA: AsmA family protein [Candidatus Angelobacter sp.]